MHQHHQTFWCNFCSSCRYVLCQTTPDDFAILLSEIIRRKCLLVQVIFIYVCFCHTWCFRNNNDVLYFKLLLCMNNNHDSVWNNFSILPNYLCLMYMLCFCFFDNFIFSQTYKNVFFYVYLVFFVTFFVWYTQSHQLVIFVHIVVLFAILCLKF